MAGHSAYSNIKHRKGAQDAKRAKVFTKIAREIIVACKSGLPEPENNPRLRAAMQAARAVNMTNDRINSAIKQGSGNQDTNNFEEMRYEGYGPGGVAVIVDCLSDNRNRTGGDVRAAFTKNGGNMGADGSVAFGFERVGLFEFPNEKASADDMLEAAIEAGADDCESNEFAHAIICKPDDFSSVREALVAKYGEADIARLSWKALNLCAVDAEKAATLIKLIDALEDNDDVQFVTTNADISDEVMEKLSA